ncbi:MAG: hypothetical protein JF595_16305 [Sphingomonadales bacterium]|nr:hypothetical protein [Sphingomonadales bacterium]
MGKTICIACGLLLAALSSAVAAAEPASWSVSPTAFSRTLENVSIDYHLVPDDYDSLKVTVTPCDASPTPWYEKDDLAPEAAQDVRNAIAEELHNARLNCKLADGLEDRIMTGFDAAYAQFETLKHAQAH